MSLKINHRLLPLIALAGVSLAGATIGMANEPAADLATTDAYGDTASLSAVGQLGHKLFYDPSLSGSGQMSCATCHDPHSASIKKIAGPRGETAKDDISALCINCHQEHSMNFPYTTHSQQGVTCVDCHVNHIETADRTAHTVPDHSFNASLDSCNTCHAQQMHTPTQQGDGTTTTASAPSAAQPTEGAQLASVTPEPEPVSRL